MILLINVWGHTNVQRDSWMVSVEIEVYMKLFLGILQRLGSIEPGSNAG